MKTDLKFYIKKLECKYENTVVFSAENIEIPKDKLTVILGPSGSGKSTFIEALGLMNKTMTNSEVYFYSDNDHYGEFVKSNMDKNGGIKLNALWTEKKKSKSRRALNEIRHNAFSFVFQDTYLMPNFSAIDNIALTDLIKGRSITESYYKIIHGLVKKLHLKNLFFKNRPSNYSGGERQRMAFGRGIFPDFEVLFGDEPTGNLDPHNAEEVLKYARACIKEKAGRCAIIVTHSIDLAIEFADQIIVLTPEQYIDEKKKYTVLDKFIFDRTYWESLKGEDKGLFREKIDFLINSEKSDQVLALSKHLIANNLEFDAGSYVRFNQENDSDPEEKKKKEDALIRKVVCEVDNRKVRNVLINEFLKKDKILIECKDRSDLWDTKKNVFKNIVFLFHRATLRFFKILIKSEIILFKKARKNHGALKPDFLNIFVYNELKEFFGKTFPRNLIFVLLIQFLIFYLIGTANGILDFVAKQDKNPFVKVINVTSSYDGIQEKMYNIHKDAKVGDIRDFGIDTVTYFAQSTFPFNPVNGRPDTLSQDDFFNAQNFKEFKEVSVRSLQPNDPMREYLLKISALRPYGTDFSDDSDMSVIVTRRFLKSLYNVDDNATQESIQNKIDKYGKISKELNRIDSTFIIRPINNAGEKCWQPLPIRGIVDQLPGDAGLICLDNLWASIAKDNTWDLAKDQLVFWIKMDSELFNTKFSSLLVDNIIKIAKDQNIHLETKDYYNSYLFKTIKSVTVKPLNEIKELYEVRIAAPNITKEKKDLVFCLLMKSNSVVDFLKVNNIPLSNIQMSYLNGLSSGGEVNYNDVNLSINSFKRIYEFRDHARRISNMELNMEKIERIKSYRIIASVTVMLSSFLIVFSILIITILLSNILSNHLTKIKKNIGLLMAFGVNTKVVYQCIMGTFIIATLIGGAALSYVVGDYLHLNKTIFEFTTGFELSDFSGFLLSWAWISDSYAIFRIITNPTLITVVFMMGFNMWRFNVIINQIFNETPGNLIYDKSNKG